MENFSSSNDPSHNLNNTSERGDEVSLQNQQPSQEVYEYVPKFIHIKEDLENLFNIEVTSERSLSYPWVKDELYRKILEDFDANKPFALDYFFQEKLLTKEDLVTRGIQDKKEKAFEILQTIKQGPRRTRIQELFVAVGLLTEKEAYDPFASFKR